MVNRTIGIEFRQLARLLFDSAAEKWYQAIGIELAVGCLAIILSLLDISGDAALFWAVVGLVLISVAYVLRLKFDSVFDDAETMRRQAVFTEGLDWPINPLQASQWRLRAGKTIREQLKKAPGEPDYYEAQDIAGPKRLAEMTLESAFYSRHLYVKLNQWIWRIFAITAVVLFTVTLLALARAIPTTVDLLIAKVVYSIIPLLLALNLLGWGFRLNRLIAAICEIEEGLDHLVKHSDPDIKPVLRIVAEYNCQVVAGLPIHNWLFERWKHEIRELWLQRQAMKSANQS